MRLLSHHPWSLRSTLISGTLLLPPLGAALSPLRADLYNAPAIPTNATLPDGTLGYWQPTVVTLISGETEAVLVDTLFTAAQAEELGDWIAATLGSRRRLSAIYVTHGHGDHWFNAAYLQRRFGPGVRVLATRGSVAHMASQLTGGFRDFWDGLFPGQIAAESFRVPAVAALDDDDDGPARFEVEGRVFDAVDVGHSDTDQTSFLHVPALRMVVAGDIVYNDVHMWMAESPAQKQRDAWLRSLDKVAEVSPQIVVGSHHRPGGVDGAFNIEASKQYIRIFSKLRQESQSAEELYNKMLEAYPDRLGKLVLWLGCQAQFAPEDGPSQPERDEL
ncbi:beta-lactamase-like protein [Hypoxylon sp. FL1284]|nr:beta-lactamase-like protein [Hypoxylon sp. FL1284]